MLITTLRIDGIKEISITTPIGIQEDGGVYGIDTSYNSWQLGENGDTTDFVDISKTVILYGDLYSITIDTGPVINSLGAFMNMDLQTYWENIFEGRFKFNNLDYQQYLVTKRTTGNNQINYPSLLEYANAAKQRIGWVEINRTRSSIYYESCNNGIGRLARSDQFYDMDSFIMTKNLFEPTLVDMRNLNSSRVGTFVYQQINPGQTGQQDFILNAIPSSQAGSKIGIQPIGEIQDSIIQNFYFDTIPYPNRFQGNRNANEYLKKLFMGIEETLDATLNDGPIQKFVNPPIQKNAVLNNIPLLYATGKENSIGGQELVSEDQNGQPISIWPGYSKSIWAQYRISDYSTNPPLFEKIQIGFKPNIDALSMGNCMPWDDGKRRGGEERRKRSDRQTGTRKRSKTESDPFGIADFKLDIPYEDFYEKMPCPTKKKLKGKDCLHVADRQSYLINDIKDLLQKSGTRIIPVGAFNPDVSISFSTQKIDKIKFRSTKSTINYADDTVYEFKNLPTDVIYAGPANQKILEELYQKTDPTLDSLKPLESRHFGKTSRFIHENDEFSAGVRNPFSPIGTSAIYPYGTFRTYSENKNGVIELKIQQVGAECLDKNEFYKSVNFLKKVSRVDDKKYEPIGVDKYGYPVFQSNDKFQSVIDSLLRNLFGFAEIVINGDQISKGWYTTYGDFWSGLTQDSTVDLKNSSQSQNYQLRQAIVTPLYVEDQITVGGEDVDMNKNKLWEPAQEGTLNDLVYVNVGPVTNYWKKDVEILENNQKQISSPYLSSNTSPIYKKYNLNDDAEWGAFIADSKIGFKQILLDPSSEWSNSEKKSLKTQILNIDELNAGRGRSRLVSMGKPYKYKNTKRLAFTYNSNNGFDVAVIPPIIYEYDYDTVCHKMDFDTRQKPGYSAFNVKCDKKTSKEPTVKSDYPTINGWVLEGLYHRDSVWGNKYGMIMDPALGWNAKAAEKCNCGTWETGGWKKVDPRRIRLEKHYYNERDLYWYNPDYYGGADGFAIDLIDDMREFKNIDGKPIFSDDQITAVLLQNIAINNFIVNNINGANITLFLRPNVSDPKRGLKDLDLEIPERNINWTGLSSDTTDYIPAGTFPEIRFQRMSSGLNYSVRYDPEPSYHRVGEFDPTQTYRAVFRKYISGKSSDDSIKNGAKQISTGISIPNGYKPTDFNKKVACELLYVVESIYKMHRARMKEINDLMKNQIDAYGVTYADSPDQSVNPSFDYYLSIIKKLHQTYKEKFNV